VNDKPEFDEAAIEAARKLFAGSCDFIAGAMTAERDGQQLPVQIRFTPETPGQYKLTLRAAPQSRERVTKNNELSAYLNVLDGGVKVAYLIGGVTIVETVFAYPGLAKLMVDAVSRRDMPLVQACAMIFCSAYILLILVADLLAILANPRLRQPK